jgi:hypothetical protein
MTISSGDAPVRDALDQLHAALERLTSLEPEDLVGEGVTEELLRDQSRLQAVVACSAQGFRRSGLWQDDGAKTAPAWLATKTRLPRRVCSRAIRLGRLAISGPTAEAWAAGEIGEAHVAVLAGACNGRTFEAFHRDEKILVDAARTLRFDHFERTVAYWSQLVDPDGADDDDEARRNRRDLYLVDSIGGMHFGRMVLDPISGAIVSGELRRIEAELFEADWAEAKAELGRDPVADELGRTPAQRRADALVEMATRSAAMPADAQRPRPLFSVLVGYETLHGRISELSSGCVLSPGTLLSWLDEAYFERAIFSLKPRVEISKRARLFTGATRRGVELRDRECAHPFCDAPVERCQVDHVIPYAAGGETTQENGRLLCGYHNRLRHKRPPPPPAPPQGRPPEPPPRT